MSAKKEELIAQYASDLKDKFGISPDMELLNKVTIALGPSIYNSDSSRVSGSDEAELQRVKQNFLIKKLGLSDDPGLMESIHKVLSTYGASKRNKHRAVVYYMLARHYKKESVF